MTHFLPSLRVLDEFEEHLLQRSPVFPPPLGTHEELRGRDDSCFKAPLLQHGRIDGAGAPGLNEGLGKKLHFLALII